MSEGEEEEVKTGKKCGNRGGDRRLLYCVFTPEGRPQSHVIDGTSVDYRVMCSCSIMKLDTGHQTTGSEEGVVRQEDKCN